MVSCTGGVVSCTGEWSVAQGEWSVAQGEWSVLHDVLLWFPPLHPSPRFDADLSAAKEEVEGEKAAKEKLAKEKDSLAAELATLQDKFKARWNHTHNTHTRTYTYPHTCTHTHTHMTVLF